MTDDRSLLPAILRDLSDHHAAIAACCLQLASAFDGEVSSVDTSTTKPRGPARGEAPPLILSHHFPPHSLRGHAERALLEEGGPLRLHEWASRIRQQGFDHPWNPKNPHQLEASLSALPSQTDVFVRVARGTFDLRVR